MRSADANHRKKTKVAQAGNFAGEHWGFGAGRRLGPAPVRTAGGPLLLMKKYGLAIWDPATWAARTPRRISRPPPL